MRRLFAFCLAFLLVPATWAQPVSESGADAPKNVILLIPDGFGPASTTMARDYLRWKHGTTQLALDTLERGSVRTFAADSRVTDSAAGATAYSTGTKTNNGFIAVDSLERPVATLVEAAEAAGMATGLVATSRLTHATPASFAAHVPDRWLENQIAAEEIAQGIDVLLGGGKRHFVPQRVNGSDRTDDRNLMNEAEANGYQVVQDRNALMQVTEGPVLGLFSMSHMDYEIDRNLTEQPSLAEMTRKTLDLVSQDEDGYFVMIEGSRIDHAGHSNDAAAHLQDILAFDEAVKVALEQAKRDENTLVVTVSDHETGGMSLGRDIGTDGVYAWKPSVLDKVTASHGVMLDSIRHAWEAQSIEPAANRAEAVDAMEPVLAHFTGIDALKPKEHVLLQESVHNMRALNFALAEVLGRRALVGWTTRGHTAVDVKLYAYGPGADRFTGNVDNTYVGTTLAELLNVDLSAHTQRLRSAREASSTSSR